MLIKSAGLRLAVVALLAYASGVIVSSCETTSSDNTGRVLGNELGSDPVNDEEAAAYNRAVLRCYRTGGSRVVKIEGRLRCF